MNSLVKVFSNFKDFYSEINGATLTGAIDVIVVEQPDGEFQCSPFHVRFGKLGVLRSREKVVDIEINGEPVDIHMKLGESGEAFFVEECPEDDIEELPANLATSPIPTYLPKYIEGDNNTSIENDKTRIASDDIQLPLPLPRRNSIDLSKELKEESTEKFENQVSDFSHRRHTDNGLERRNLSDKLKEYTTQKLRQEWAEHEELFPIDNIQEWSNSTLNEQTDQNQEKSEPKEGSESIESKVPSTTEKPEESISEKKDEQQPQASVGNSNNNNGESKGKKKRRKKSQMKKKNAQRKSSSSSSLGSTTPQEANDLEPDTNSVTNNTNSSNDESPSKTDETATKSEPMKTAENTMSENKMSQTNAAPSRVQDLDAHYFFSDTELTAGVHNSRPNTPIQSDSELEISQRDKGNAGDLMTNSASWKWGELPTQSEDQKDAPQAQRNSMLSGMFSFMKKTNKLRKTSNDGGVYLSELDAEGMDPEMAALYFPSIKDSSTVGNEDDRESGNGTSLPHSPSSMEGQKSLDSDYDDGKQASSDKYLDFVAMSLSGGMDKGGPTDEEFDQNIIKYADVCQNPSIFSMPNLVVRLNGKYYSWTAACPIVMTIIAFQKPLSDGAVEQLMNKSNVPENAESIDSKQVPAAKSAYSWWRWRRSAAGNQGVSGDDKGVKNDSVDGDQTAVATQTSRSNTPDLSENTMSKTDGSTLNADNTSAILEADDLSQSQTTLDKSSSSKSEKYKKSLRLSSEAIKQLNLKPGMNEIEFSVTTAYQGTSRCKCYLFRWKHSDKVVISDIDGTITKSDVLGHILPMVGKDWAQLGVAQLFSKIEQNGYKLLYLSARAIGQSRVTREYLRSIRQGDVKLPDGPLLLNPTSLISAFHREVIERKPEEFKIACLSDIQALFPEKNPFYAGYGNRINDVWAYRAVGIPIMRIFTINTKGELKHELTQTFQSSYINQSLEVNEYFPALEIDDETDVFDDDEEDELQFSQSETSDNYDDDGDNNDVNNNSRRNSRDK